MTDLQNPIFTDENKAREALEAVRWPYGPVCPHCGNLDPTTIAKVEGKKHSHRPGLYYCNACKGQFTVTVGTVFERSKIPLSKWMLAAHLLNSSKKGMSSHQMHRMLGVTYKTAWFMTHRIREAMKVLAPEPLGGDGKIVEADETYFGAKDHVTTRTKKSRPGLKSKRAVLALVERGGSVRTFHVKEATAWEVNKVLAQNIARETALHTDESALYKWVGQRFASHETVTHSLEEYVRGIVHTNTIEGFFSIFKRGMRGIYQHCGEAHLHRYLAEFDFRYNNRKITDKERAVRALEGIEGKRLMYRRPGKAPLN
jgi:transposase-like protein